MQLELTALLLLTFQLLNFLHVDPELLLQFPLILLQLLYQLLKVL